MVGTKLKQNNWDLNANLVHTLKMLPDIKNARYVRRRFSKPM